MSFNGNEGSAIDMKTADALTSEYQSTYSGTTKGVFIGRDHIQRLLDLTDSKGIRVYFGRDDDGDNTIVMVAANSNEDDIPSLIIDCGIRCPNRCGSVNKLNA